MSAWDRFEFKAVISYSGYAKTRMPFMRIELERVGIAGYHVFCGIENPYEEMAFDGVRHMGNMNYRTNSCTMEHYRAIKTAYETGAKSVLVMEDDVRFLKNTKTVEAGVVDIPDDYDLAKFEWFFGRKQNPEERKEICARPYAGKSHTWTDGKGAITVGAACYAMSRNGMRWIIELIEDAAKRKGQGRLRVIDMYHRPWPSDRIRMYIANPLLARQNDSSVTINEHAKDYRGIALPREFYAP